MDITRGKDWKILSPMLKSWGRDDDVSFVVDQFSGSLQNLGVDSVSENDMLVRLFIAGYVGCKLKKSLSCVELRSPASRHVTSAVTI